MNSKLTERQPPAAHVDVIAAAAPVVETSDALRPSVLRDYWVLTKPEITLLVVLSAFAGYLMGRPGEIDLGTVLALLVGVGMTSAGVGALNQYLERDLDALMRRTSLRPIPAGRIDASSAAIFGSFLVIGGVALLCPLTNPLTGVLAAATVLLYLFVYTPLKRKTSLNTLVGTVPGAVPALGGWTAATNDLSAGGWILFAILAAWQMPHFLSLAWTYRKDYLRAGMVMPAAKGADREMAVQMVLFTAVLLPLGPIPWILDYAGPLYGIGTALLGAAFLLTVLQFVRAPKPLTARRVLLASVAYIPLLLALLIADRLF